MNVLSRALSGAVLSGALVASLAACSAEATPAVSPSPTTGATSAAADDQGTWPRTITHEMGETVIESKPENIASTSLTITGTLLAIDAPITWSAATSLSSSTDENGFFTQWADTAIAEGVQVLYPDLEIDLEAVMVADPDLIVVSLTGADSTSEQYEQLSEIAPTIVLDYSSQTWQDLAAELGAATGLEDQVEQVVADFDAHVADVKDSLTLPEGTTNLLVFNGPGENGVAKPGGSHATLLTALGFDVVGAPDELDVSTSVRQDFAFVSLENLTTALSGQTILLISADDTKVAELTGTAVLANAPAVAAGTVHALGSDTFRIDYFSANNLIDVVQGIYG